jgi:hypothetical protein
VSGIMSSDKAEKLLDSIVSRVDNITEPDYKSEAYLKLLKLSHPFVVPTRLKNC